MPRFESEAELAGEVAKWLRADGWELWFEVVGRGGSRADIVAKRGPVYMIVETKLNLGFNVLAQCESWVRMGAAHRVLCSVPLGKQTDGRRLAVRWSNDKGISVLEMPKIDDDEAEWYAKAKREGISAKWSDFRRIRASHSIAKQLCDEQKDSAPSVAHGGYVTAFTRTCDRLREFVAKHGGRVSVHEAVGNISHHYAGDRSARACLRKLVEDGYVKGLGIEREGRKPFFVTKKEETTS